MEIVQDKYRKQGVIGTILFHLLLLLLFLQYGMPYQDPPAENEGGMLINFGTSEQGKGDEPVVEAASSSSKSVAENTNTPSENSAPEEIITQNDAVTININANENKKKQKDSPKEQPKTIDENLANALGTLANPKESSSNSQGITNTTGDQGSQEGDVNSNNYKGKGLGNGIGFSLNGRSLESIKTPKNPTQKDGRVVVNIIVDQRGNVVRAVPGGRGSTTTNTTLYKIAKKAALQAKFDVNSSAPEEQKGQMTFVFILN